MQTSKRISKGVKRSSVSGRQEEKPEAEPKARVVTPGFLGGRQCCNCSLSWVCLERYSPLCVRSAYHVGTEETASSEAPSVSLFCAYPTSWMRRTP